MLLLYNIIKNMFPTEIKLNIISQKQIGAQSLKQLRLVEKDDVKTENKDIVGIFYTCFIDALHC